MWDNKWVHVFDRGGRFLGTGRIYRSDHNGLDVEGICTSWPKYMTKPVALSEAVDLEAKWKARRAREQHIEANKVYRTHA